MGIVVGGEGMNGKQRWGVILKSMRGLMEEHGFMMRVGYILGGVAVFIVIFMGLIFGVSFSTIFWRLLTYGLIFSIMGLGIGYLLEKYIGGFEGLGGVGEDGVEGVGGEGGVLEEGEGKGGEVDYMVREEEEEREEMKDLWVGGEERNVGKGNGVKEGKKILEEMVIKDPKLLANRVRSMLKKDE